MNKEQFLANDLGTIIANQAIMIAELKATNQQLQSQTHELQTKCKMLSTNTKQVTKDKRKDAN